MNRVIILGVSADIGSNICKLFHGDGFDVIGTYRNDFDARSELEGLENVRLIQCDLTQSLDVQRLTDFVRSQEFKWTHLFSSVGTSEPIGRFFDLDFDDWEKSVTINMTSQLRAVHSLYPLRDSSRQANIALLAGGGTNNPFRCYSSYAVAKIGLIKMCELIDDETEDLNIFIVGPGFVKTKTHFETLRAGEKAESNFGRVKEFMDSNDKGTSFEDIYKCLQWGAAMGREVAGGRNFSVVHDKWGTERLESELKQDNDMYKLRRYRNNWK
jgi:NAD(P)-dependent dehydrogenase (short-subunit alcohol dehydrogenase family)